MAVILTRRSWLRGTGCLALGGSACARWPEARPGATPGGRTIVVQAFEISWPGAARDDLTVYDDGWAYVSRWDGTLIGPKTEVWHRCLSLDAAALERWSTRLADPSLTSLPREYRPEGMVMDGDLAHYGRPGDPFVIDNVFSLPPPVARLRDDARALMERVAEAGSDALIAPGLPPRARLLARHRLFRDHGTPRHDDLRIYDDGVIDYRLYQANKRDPSGVIAVSDVRAIDPAAVEVLRRRVRAVDGLGHQSFFLDADGFATHFIEAGASTVIAHGLGEQSSPQPLRALLDELLGLRGHYADLARGR